MNHSEYQKKVKTMTAAELKYTITDAKAAERAYPEGYKAGYYLDEVSYCASELKRRGL
jgi:DUF917 family protein